MAVVFNEKTGKWEEVKEPLPIGSKGRAAEVTAAAYKNAGVTPPVDKGISGGIAFDRNAMELARTGIDAEKAQKIADEKLADEKSEARFRTAEGIGYPNKPASQIGDQPHPPKATGIGVSQKPNARVGKVNSPPPKADGIGNFDLIQRSTNEDYVPGQLPMSTNEGEDTPPLTPKPPTWKDKLSGIGEGLGKWASDPKIARALTMAGLTTLATEPRRVPYSNAEMLGRAGLAGIGAYDQAAAGEAAGREAARKAGIEEREIAVKERPTVKESEIYMKNGRPVRDIYDETGKVVRTVSAYIGDSGAGRGRAGGGGGIGDIENEALKYAAQQRVAAKKEGYSDEEANVIGNEAYDYYIKQPGTIYKEITPPKTGDWLNKKTPATYGTMPRGTTYTPEQIAAEIKRRGIKRGQ